MTSALAGVPGQRLPDQPRTDLRRGGQRRADDRAEQTRADLTSAVLSLAEAEADAAADALHDGALQALVVARYAADAAVRGGDPVVARDAVQEALVALRRAVWLLRPRGDQGLLEALGQLAGQVAATGGAALVLDVDESLADVLDDELAPAAATAAYRLVQRTAGELPLTVRVRRTASGVRIALDVPLTDPAGEALRARAVGGALLATRDGASLHLPLSRPLAPLHAVRPEVLR
jgi:two-component system, NarL family, sensor kinase